MTETARAAILAEIEQNRDLYIEFLQSFIQAASPNPPGTTTRAADCIAEFLSSCEINHSVVCAPGHQGEPNVLAQFSGAKGQGARVIFNGHIDTYPVEKPEDWGERGPYSGHNDGSSIHGRGAVDMNAGTAASIIAFSLLHKRANDLTESVGLAAVSDEETGGMFGTRFLLENFGEESPWKGDVVLNGEPGGLESIRFGEKGTLRISFTVGTPGGNGAYKHISRGAIIIASKLISDLLSIESMNSPLPDQLRKHFESDNVRRIADKIMGPGAADILLQPTLNIGTIHGGAKVNTIPQECSFEADIRLPIGLTHSAVLEHIDNILQGYPECSYEIQHAASNPSNYLAPEHRFVDAVSKVAEEVTGHRPILLAGLGGTDCKFYRYAGTPAYVYGPSPRGMGGSDESVMIEEFFAVLKTHALSVWDYLAASH